ncbi:hypothetical protein CQW23_28018 [Capsicum baccatum]|uniref:Uncharacterized protein n=1 Tax=Capsicum baccatum TaxID=33114 RepID=A0A2G2VFB3_CAPBA|nr:hypothetical protein CQW23_28018 [Capsicum baccatum]
MFKSFLFEEPSSITTAIFVVTFVLLAYLGVSEIIGKHIRYSKFYKVNPGSASHCSNFLQGKVSSRNGMLIVYTPACIIGIASFLMYPNGGTRFMMLKSAVTIHFFKKLLEVDSFVTIDEVDSFVTIDDFL